MIDFICEKVRVGTTEGVYLSSLDSTLRLDAERMFLGNSNWQKIQGRSSWIAYGIAGVGKKDGRCRKGLYLAC